MLWEWEISLKRSMLILDTANDICNINKKSGTFIDKMCNFIGKVFRKIVKLWMSSVKFDPWLSYWLFTQSNTFNFLMNSQIVFMNIQNQEKIHDPSAFWQIILESKITVNHFLSYTSSDWKSATEKAATEGCWWL